MSKKSRIKELEQTVADLSEHIGKLNNIVFHLRLDLNQKLAKPTLYGKSTIFDGPYESTFELHRHPTIPDFIPDINHDLKPSFVLESDHD